MTTAQKLALYPLAERWALLSELQKRRWLALAQTFSSLPQPEQEKLHSRMTEWASLSAQQRNQARLNYANTNRLAPDNKLAQWEAYLALSEEEKNKLAADAPVKPQGAATALRPESPKKLAQVPAANMANPLQANPPKIAQGSDTAHRTPAPPASAAQEASPSAAPVVETAPITTPSAVGSTLPPMPVPAPATETSKPAMLEPS
ncbi:MAG: DUF3106 domain-containing protein [Burkholderiaceae bacterium]|nr:DUF3106 domain-containing protein [Burkholderiaceae bacterium]